MNRLTQRLQQLRAAGRSGLVTYLTAGDPDAATSLALLTRLGAAGADLIELGMPFSDPVADGPTIQAAHLRALASGQTLAATLQLVSRLRQHDQTTPLLLMGYLNPLLQYGVEPFMAAAAAAGVDGLLLVDLPFEHAAPYRAAARQHGLQLIAMTAPGSDAARLAHWLPYAEGFVYHVSLNGITGSAAADSDALTAHVARLRTLTPLPIALGFGLRTPQQLAALNRQADLLVVGSALVATLARDGVEATLQQVRQLAAALQPDSAG